MSQTAKGTNIFQWKKSKKLKICFCLRVMRVPVRVWHVISLFQMAKLERLLFFPFLCVMNRNRK